MRHLLGAEGRAALSDFGKDALFAFDFDGTLAPICSDPAAVMLIGPVLEQFRALCVAAPVGLITGRSVVDVWPRLGTVPTWIIGNHGAEGIPGDDPAVLAFQAAACATWRHQLLSDQRWPQREEGIWLEDKIYSLCLHYRNTSNPDSAHAALLPLLTQLLPAPHWIPGKCTINLLAPGARDKYGALSQLAQISDASDVFYIGDDMTDETVFRQAPPHWVTVRVGPAPETSARFVLPEQRDILACLRMLIESVSRLGGLSQLRPWF